MYIIFLGDSVPLWCVLSGCFVASNEAKKEHKRVIDVESLVKDQTKLAISLVLLCSFSVGTPVGVVVDHHTMSCFPVSCGRFSLLI